MSAQVPGAAVPGTSVPSGSLVSPGGAQGVGGLQGAAGPNAVSGDSSNLLTLGSDSKVYLPPSAIDPEIQLVRLRSFNAIGNPTFEVDSRTCFTGVTASGFAQDRWQSATNLGVSCVPTAGLVVLPGSNFNLTQYFLRCKVTTQKTTLAAGDYQEVVQSIEGPLLRELLSDVHSIQVLVRSSVAGLIVGLSFRDSGNANSLTVPVTITNANTWYLLSVPNLSSFASSAATWSTLPGNTGYQLSLSLGCGATYTAPANGSWRSGYWIAALGQSNFFANAVGSTFDIAFVQHEPGPYCTTPIDCPFGVNYDGSMGCQRYYQKTYSYITKPGTANASPGLSSLYLVAANLAAPYGPVSFKKTMAKPPTMTSYAYDGTVNAATVVGGSSVSVAGMVNIGDAGFNAISLSANGVAGNMYQIHYTADTGW